MVVVVTPCSDQMPGVTQVGKQVFVQTFISQPTIE